MESGNKLISKLWRTKERNLECIMHRKLLPWISPFSQDDAQAYPVRVDKGDENKQSSQTNTFAAAEDSAPMVITTPVNPPPIVAIETIRRHQTAMEKV